MRRVVLFACFLVALGLLALPASAGVVAKISISNQTMNVYVNGVRKHNWAVSTARRGYRTPVGSFRPTRMHKTYYSRKYNNSPMPHSIFFYGGYAIHGTNYTKSLGRPASHGCIQATRRRCSASSSGTARGRRRSSSRARACRAVA